MRGLVLVAAGGIMAVLHTASAAAQEQQSPLPAQFPLATEACFGRVYDAAHMKAHPKQRVTRFFVAREFSPDTALEEEPLSADEAKKSDGEYSRVVVNAYVRFRDRKGVYSNGLNCGKSDGRVSCAVDCDGGSFNLKPDGTGLLLENNGFVVVGGCGASEDEHENEEYVRPGADDKLFRLESKPLAACIAERTAMAPAWVKLGAPLRERFKQEVVCLSRDYDPQHLAAHPKQTIKRIAVLKTRESKPDPDAHAYALRFRLQTRDGKTFDGATDCAPDRYAFSCQPKIPMDADRYFYLTRAGDDAVMLRDKNGLLGSLFGATLSEDDRVIKLRASPEAACRF